jgi:hypothetical protein
LRLDAIFAALSLERLGFFLGVKGFGGVLSSRFSTSSRLGALGMANNPKDNRFLIAVGQLVVDWNFAEGWLRQLLVTLTQLDRETAQILTAELGAIGLENALSAFATHRLPDEEGAAVRHALKMYELLRAYRNYYIHNIAFDAGSFGVTAEVSAKGKVKANSDRLEPETLKAVSDQCAVLGGYIHLIHERISRLGQHGALPPLPDKPPLPEKLAKTPMRLLPHLSPRPASPA